MGAAAVEGRARRMLRASWVCAALSLWSGIAAAQNPTSDTRIPSNGTNGDGMDTHLFRPAVDSKGFFSVNGSDIIAANDISFGLILDYGRNLMRINPDRPDACDTDAATATPNCPAGVAPNPGTGGGNALVRDSFQGTLHFNYGIANRLILGLSVPLILMAARDPANDIGPDVARYNAAALDAQEFEGIALHAKFRLLRVESGLGLSLIGQIGVPLGGAERDLGADPGTWYWPQVVVEKQFGAARRFKIGVNVGYRGHTGTNPKFEHDSNNLPQLTEGIFEYSNLLTEGLGLSYRAFDSLDLVAETYGTLQTSGESTAGQKFSQEWLGGIKLFVERNSYLMMGAGTRYPLSTGFEAADLRLVLGFIFEPSIGDRDGDGYKDDEDKCPDEPEDFDGFQDEDGCPDPDNDQDGILDGDDRCPNVPEDKDGDEDDDGCPEGHEGDRDGDGILDSRDKCPDEPEDRDGFQDSDGCPDPDNDKDGILDKDDACPLDPEDKDGFQDADGCPEPDNDKDQIPDKRDKCPNDPETYNGFQDEDGCPDKGKVVIEGSNIVILDKINFETNSAKILPESEPIIDAVASTLKGHPEFKAVEVGGHADERSTDEHNLQLTRARAASVVDALVKKGINKNRLVSQGYGEYCPLDPGHNAAAWDKNRRVEFKVIKTDEGDTGVTRGCDTARSKGVLPPKAP